MSYYTSQPFMRPGMSFVITCKRCNRAVLAGVEIFPRENIVVGCPLCCELRRYRPSEVYLGYVDTRISEQKASLRNCRPRGRR